MKTTLLNYCITTFALITTLNLNAQVFWTEGFGTGCNQGQVANGFVSVNGTWTSAATGTNQAKANKWFVSAQENGHLPGECGTGCGNNQTLHLGSVSAFGGLIPADLGAAYNAGSGNYITNVRAESPLINCTGKTNITLSFSYIENGDGFIDDCTLWYFDGSTWSQIANTAKTSLCGGQGLWTAFSIALPSSADNNAGIKIGFNWTNNADNIGTDPSFAVDDIQLSTPVPLPVTLLSFDVKLLQNDLSIVWETQSEKNNAYFTVQRSKDNIDWTDLERVNGSIASFTKKTYRVIDKSPLAGLSYYRLLQTDLDLVTRTISEPKSYLNDKSIAFNLLPNPVYGNKFELMIESKQIYCHKQDWGVN
jgi:hypothetical protein